MVQEPWRKVFDEGGFRALGFIWGVSENRGPQHSTLNSRILILKDPK